jgi:hypothetical protein
MGFNRRKLEDQRRMIDPFEELLDALGSKAIHRQADRTRHYVRWPGRYCH